MTVVINALFVLSNNMTELKKIKQVLAKDGNRAYKDVKSQSGAYVMRGNAIVRVTADGNIHVIKKTRQSRVKVKESDRIVVLK